MNKKLILSVVALLLVAVMAWFIFGGSRGDNQNQTVKVATFSRAVDYAPLYVAEHLGWLEKDGVTIEVAEFSDMASIESNLSTGNLDVLFAAAPPVAILRSKGSKLKIEGLSCTLRQEIVVRSVLNASSITDIDGKKIAVMENTSSHYGVLRAFEQSGLKSPVLEFMVPPQADLAFRNGRVDAWAVWPPFIENIEIEGLGFPIKGGDAIIQSVYATTEKSRLDRDENISFVLKKIEDAKSWMISNPSEAQTIVAEKLGIDRKVIELSWNKHNWGAGLNDDLRKDVTEKINFLINQGVIDSDSRETTTDIFK